MPYDQLEEIQSRRGEKIAMFLTLENACGLIVAAFPAYLITAGMPFVLRLLIVAVAAGLGVLVTVDVGGMPGYEHALWTVRGVTRRRLNGTQVIPAQLLGTTTTTPADRPLPQDGPIRRASPPSLALDPPPPPVGSTGQEPPPDEHLSL